MNNTKVLQAISALNKDFDAKGDTSAKDIIKRITTHFLKKNYVDLDVAVFELQNLKDYSETTFKGIYTTVNTIYDNVYNNNKSAIFSYNIDKIKEAEEHFKNPKVDDKIAVTITTTTCKRTDLITRTVDSFLECVLDYKTYVKEWIIIDDNSSDKDRQFMKERYPFIRFIYKNTEQKGHPRSMNMLLKEIKTPYVFNLEDDFEFFRRDNYFKRMINIVNIDKSYGQCLLNINYSEDTDSANNLWGSSMKKSKENGRYFIHNFYTGKELEEAQRKVGCASCLYWPHFSFRAGITKTSVLKELGEYDEKAKHFEMEYAYRYVTKGYKTTFLDGVYCAHIGRRTYERNTEKKNAYDLNEEVQFGEEHRVKKDEIPKIEKENIDIATYVINLKRRPDRLRNFFTKNQKELFPLSVFEGVDGKTLQPSHKVQKAFSTGDYNYRRGIVGCAMSHMKIWKEFLTKANQTFCLVLEDDAELCPEFKDKVLYLINKHSANFDIMFLHYNPYPQYNKKELYTNTPPVAELWPKERSMRENMGSGAGYILTRQGALNLLRHVQKNGVYNAIDWVMFKSENRIMYVTPLLVRANCFQTTTGTDTDIQNVYNSVCFTGIDWDQYELQYLADKLLSSYHNKDKSAIVNLYYKGFDEKEINTLISDRKKFTLSKNLKNGLTIAITKTSELSQLKDHVCVLPISEKDVVKQLINLQPIKSYTTNNFVYSIPDKYLDNIIEDKVWDDSLMNVSCPF
jgi:GR25 family glycosyltransferase involved in LPS biosynthesis